MANVKVINAHINASVSQRVSVSAIYELYANGLSLSTWKRA
jgi:hypothetical protein